MINSNYIFFFLNLFFYKTRLDIYFFKVMFNFWKIIRREKCYEKLIIFPAKN